MRVPRGVIPAIGLAVLVAGCGGSAAPTRAPATGASIEPSAAASTAPTAGPPASIPPIETQPPTDPPGIEPTEAPSSPPGSAEPGAAGACTGSDANRDFFASVATAVAWPVYCPALPGGWFVDAGEYRLASGGRMEITYRGPAGASFQLRQGSFCTTDGGCLPAGTDLGEAPFGDLSGTLVSADDGSWALGVDAGAEISWLAVGQGLDEAAFRRFAEGLTLVSD